MVLTATEPSPDNLDVSGPKTIFVTERRKLRARGHLSKNHFVTLGPLTPRDSLTSQRGKLGQAGACAGAGTRS